VITNSFLYTQCVQLTDIDNDNDLDILAAAFNGNSISLWINDGNSNPSWTKVVVDDSFGGAHWAEASDLDKDGDLDIVGASFNDSQIAVWFNLGGNPLTFRKQVMATNFPGVVTVKPGDIDLDGDTDVVATAWSGSIVAWFENRINDGLSWSRNTISSSFSGAWPVALSDMDQDSDLDILAGGDVLGNPGTSAALTLWENTMVQTGTPDDLQREEKLIIKYPSEDNTIGLNCRSSFVGKVELSFFNSTGSLIRREYFQKTDFEQEFSLEINPLTFKSGIYLISGVMGYTHCTKKVLICLGP
jgi:hypothetical protein